MVKEPIIPNLRLVPATIATSAKYMVSGLRVVKLSENASGKMEDSALMSQQNGESPYPLVSGTDLYGYNLIVPITIKGKTDTITLQEAVVNVSRSRNIVATPVLNGRGTVKEMITEGDIDLSISVAVVSLSDDGSYDESLPTYHDVYPYKGVERLRRLLDEMDRLEIVSDFLKLFDLDGGDFGIVVKSYSVNQDTHTNRQVFEIHAVSDYDYNLLIED